MKETALVFGPTSFIGAHCVARMLSEGVEVSVAVRRGSKHKARLAAVADRVRMHEFDDVGDLGDLSGRRFDYVFNFITDYGRDAGATLSRMIRANIHLPILLIEATSSRFFINIDTTLPEVNFYAYTKAACSGILRDYCAAKRKIINLKLERVYGPGDDDTKFLTRLVAQLKANAAVDMTLGEQNIDFLHVDDCARGVLHLVRRMEPAAAGFEEIRIGSGSPVVLRELVEFIRTQVGSKSRINYGTVAYRKNEKMFSKAEVADLKDWKPTISIFDVDFKNFV